MKQIYKSILILALVVTGYTASAVSMGQIVGRVVINETQEPVAFAEIIFENNMDKITVTANEFGYYYADHMPTGRYEMRVVYNEHTFRISKVRVYDSYTTELNFTVSNNTKLPAVVDMEGTPNIFSSASPTDIVITNDGSPEQKQTRPLWEVLSMQAGVDGISGRVKGAPVKVYVDGTPVMGGVRW